MAKEKEIDVVVKEQMELEWASGGSKEGKTKEDFAKWYELTTGAHIRECLSTRWQIYAHGKPKVIAGIGLEDEEDFAATRDEAFKIALEYYAINRLTIGSLPKGPFTIFVGNRGVDRDLLNHTNGYTDTYEITVQIKKLGRVKTPQVRRKK